MSRSQDLAYAFRALHRSPLFTLTAILSVAVGIGGATSVMVLFGVEPLDPISFVSGVALFAIVTLAASLIPARRAAAANPVAALRAE